MGENIEMTGTQINQTDRIQADIRHTEAQISQTVHTLEERLSPSNLKRQAVQKARHSLLVGAARVMEFVERKPVPTALAGAGIILLMVLKSRRHARAESRGTGKEIAGAAAKGFLSGMAKNTRKKSVRPGTTIVWRSLASALGATLSTLWYRRKHERPVTETGIVSDLPRAGAYPVGTPFLEHIPASK
ncbi:DUF3618 domain-containing protein [Geobacter sp. DSM 9736]|uniref:DUF3618 domain-containing protein n=1 Tax=Geobacter sp. DSM 9736 TaxID=1277350 RepID=UPI000B50660B|nr:DUF3618 domain-containing protein [Geobacter sp. DSM 9736]SNB46785.1 Protein of unknown function [Geobacter sp. DSM 9736]